ncbi:hypothetical protein [Streptomyces sp. NPDC098781]|uniref:hypothetical protein n=1 Tax=Streptomyces sp. NPDC098781 TaxID=3366097 RepID=UPI00382B20F0
MEEPAQTTSPRAGAARRRPVPPPALCGFLLLLALVFTVSYAVGSAAGPVAPGMHRSGTSGQDGGGGTDMEHGGTGGMDMNHGSGN